jgi:heterodisulfide reductase subunit A-like polyferredoxin
LAQLGFYIDFRTGGKNYGEFVKRAQREYGAIDIQGRVSKIYEKGNKLIVRGVDTLAGKQVEVEAQRSPFEQRGSLKNRVSLIPLFGKEG